MIRSYRLNFQDRAPFAARAVGPVILLIALAVASGCAKPQAAPPARLATTVSVGKVTQKTEPVEVTAVGNVEAISTVSIRAQVPGEVQNVPFKEGDFVKKGQVLLTIDPRPYDALHSLKPKPLSPGIKPRASTTARKPCDTNRCSIKGWYPPSRWTPSYTSAADASDAVLNADEAAVKTAELNLEFCTITSPIDGRTGTIMVKAGNLVKVADVPIVIINQVNPIYVNFTVPQQYWPDIKEHVDQGMLRVMATIPQDPGPPVQGTLTFIDNNVDTGTGTIHLRGTFENQQNRLWPGLFVSILLTLSTQPNATVVPAQSVVSTQQGSYVYVVKPNNTVEQRTIVTSRTINGDTVVEKGLQPGETIVTDGQVNLIPGAKIEIKNGSAGSMDRAADRADAQSGAADPPTNKSSTGTSQ